MVAATGSCSMDRRNPGAFPSASDVMFGGAQEISTMLVSGVEDAIGAFGALNDFIYDHGGDDGDMYTLLSDGDGDGDIVERSEGRFDMVCSSAAALGDHGHRGRTTTTAITTTSTLDDDERDQAPTTEPVTMIQRRQSRPILRGAKSPPPATPGPSTLKSKPKSKPKNRTLLSNKQIRTKKGDKSTIVTKKLSNASPKKSQARSVVGRTNNIHRTTRTKAMRTAAAAAAAAATITATTTTARSNKTKALGRSLSRSSAPVPPHLTHRKRVQTVTPTTTSTSTAQQQKTTPVPPPVAFIRIASRKSTAVAATNATSTSTTPSKKQSNSSIQAATTATSTSTTPSKKQCNSSIQAATTASAMATPKKKRKGMFSIFRGGKNKNITADRETTETSNEKSSDALDVIIVPVPSKKEVDDTELLVLSNQRSVIILEKSQELPAGKMGANQQEQQQQQQQAPQKEERHEPMPDVGAMATSFIASAGGFLLSSMKLFEPSSGTADTDEAVCAKASSPITDAAITATDPVVEEQGKVTTSDATAIQDASEVGTKQRITPISTDTQDGAVAESLKNQAVVQSRSATAPSKKQVNDTANPVEPICISAIEKKGTVVDVTQLATTKQPSKRLSNTQLPTINNPSGSELLVPQTTRKISRSKVISNSSSVKAPTKTANKTKQVVVVKSKGSSVPDKSKKVRKMSTKSKIPGKSSSIFGRWFHHSSTTKATALLNKEVATDAKEEEKGDWPDATSISKKEQQQRSKELKSKRKSNFLNLNEDDDCTHHEMDGVLIFEAPSKLVQQEIAMRDPFESSYFRAHGTIASNLTLSSGESAIWDDAEHAGCYDDDDNDDDNDEDNDGYGTPHTKVKASSVPMRLVPHQESWMEILEGAAANEEASIDSALHDRYA